MSHAERRLVGIRGATTLESGATPGATQVVEATRDLLLALVAANDLRAEHLVSALFTVTPDLQVAFPAEAARAIGWQDVPLMCAVEIDVPGALNRCVRVLLHAHASTPVKHVYLRGATGLRPDLGYE